jgi:hypothetical protein
MGKSSISMAIFNSYIDITKRVPPFFHSPGVYLSIQGQYLEYQPIDITQAHRKIQKKRGFWLSPLQNKHDFEIWKNKKNKCCKSLPSTSINCKNSLYLSWIANPIAVDFMRAPATDFRPASRHNPRGHLHCTRCSSYGRWRKGCNHGIKYHWTPMFLGI